MACENETGHVPTASFITYSPGATNDTIAVRRRTPDVNLKGVECAREAPRREPEPHALESPFDQGRPETLAFRLRNRRPASLLPGKPQLAGVRRLPPHMDPAAVVGERAVFGCIGRQ